ncbi:MAG: ABC transporter ATP-binding protein [Bacillota bacterium]|nr:ABC transporter ATP-binding protein [Bacillota bacterium]
MITFESVTKKYNDVTVVDRLDLTIHDGEFVILIGPSGCGKTTTLKMINKLIEMDEGAITIDGQNIAAINGDELRREIGYVIQQIGLFPNLTIKENILVVPRLLKWDEEKCTKRVHELLELVGMPYEENAMKYPNELSGGQQQRIGVLRALAGEPPIILMDEPFGALDPVTREGLQDELKQLQQKLHKTIIFVTHDMDEALKMADKIVFMSDGKILQVASPEEMLANPADPIITNFMGRHAVSAEDRYLDVTCGEVMETNLLTVSIMENPLEAATRMKSGGIQMAVVIDEHGQPAGVVTLERIKEARQPAETISEIVDTDVGTVGVTDRAKDAFNDLVQSNRQYLLVMDETHAAAGVITRDSITNSLARLVWGDIEWAL